MTMLVVWIVAIDRPLLQLTPPSDLRTQQPIAQSGDTLTVFLVDIQRLSGSDVVAEQIPDELLIVGHAIFRRSMLRGPTQGRQEQAVWPLFQEVFPEFTHLFQNRVGHLLQVIQILIEGKMFPDMPRVPCIGGIVPSPPMTAVDIVRGAGRPAPDRAVGRLEFRSVFGYLAARPPQTLNHVQQGLMAFGEIRRFGWPVVHLDVDVRVVVTMPGRSVTVVPQPL